MTCKTCGNECDPSALSCNRCGADQPPPETAAEFTATTDRSRLLAPAPAPAAKDVAAAEPAVFTNWEPVAPPAVEQPWSSPGAPPPEVVLVSAAMLVLAALLAYPIVKYAFPLVPDLFSHNSFERAISALFVYVFVMIAACSVALVALAVGLLRGSRVAQALTILVAASIAIGELVSGQTGAQGLQARNAITAAIVLICLALIALLAFLPGARRFFALDNSPLGVLATATTCVYFGWCMAVAGVILAVAGSIQVKFVWWGITFAALGIALSWLGRPLRIGHLWARALTSAALLTYVVVDMVFAHDGGTLKATGNVIQVAVGLGSIGLLWLLPSSTQHFATGPHPDRSNPAVRRASWLTIGVLIIVGAGFSLSAAGNSSPSQSGLNEPQFVNSPQPSAVVPSQAADPAVPAGELSNIWTVHESAEGGYTESVTLSVGRPQHFQQGLSEGQLTAGSACSVDPDTDAVVPAQLAETNTNTTFSAYTASAFSFGSQWSSPAVEVQFSDGPQCESDGLNEHSTAKVSPGSRSATSMFFILRGYYSPDQPDGDPAVLAAAIVQFTTASYSPDDGSESLQYAPASTTGPGVGSDGAIPLGGLSSGQPTAFSSAAADPTDSPTPEPSELPGDLTDQVGPSDDGGCAGHTTGQLADYLNSRGCTEMARSLYTMTVAGRPAVIAVADLTLADASDVDEFAALSTQNGTGDVLTLIHDGDSFAGAPAAFTDDPTYLAQGGSGAGEVVVLQAMWNDGGPTHADDPALAAMLKQVLASVQ